MTNVTEAKAALRRRLRAARRAAAANPARGELVASEVLTHPAVSRRLAEPGARVAAYVSLPWEPPTDVLREQLRGAGIEVLLPVADPRGGLTWVRDDGSAGAAWGVPGQPAAPATPKAATTDAAALASPTAQDAAGAAVVIVPALAATADGRRLGQGGGYYDRFLANLPAASAGGPLLVAVVGPGEVLDDVPTEPHDRRVDTVVVA